VEPSASRGDDVDPTGPAAATVANLTSWLPPRGRIEIRVTEDEHAVEDIAARTLGVSLSEFYRRAARERAAEILAERSRVVLDDNAAQRFLDAVDHPERFADRLRWLADRPSVL